LNTAFWQPRDDTRTQPRTQHGGADHRDQRGRIDGDGGNKDECLRDRG
jgi:hypothetical protein